MDLGLRSPLVEAFRRGAVDRDLRLAAAQGDIAPRPVEQLGLLMLLCADADADIKTAAEETLGRLDVAAVAGFLARSDTPVELRDFFMARGLAPASTPSLDPLLPLFAAAAADVAVADSAAAGGAAGVAAETTGPDSATADAERATVMQQLGEMSVPQKVKAAMKGTREMRAMLIRDPNRMVAAAVLSCPKLTEQEVETFARMGNVAEEVLRTIAQSRGWTKNYGIALGLVKNSKTPVAVSMHLLHRLNDKDVRALSTDRNIAEALRISARKRVVAGTQR